MKLRKLVTEIVFRDTALQKATGLMFKFKFEDCAYVFPFDEDRKIPIHMFFVFFSIDVLWLNKDGYIVDLKRNVKPFTPAVYHRGKACTLIELPKGSISKFNIKLMDKFEI